MKLLAACLAACLTTAALSARPAAAQEVTPIAAEADDDMLELALSLDLRALGDGITAYRIEGDYFTILGLPLLGLLDLLRQHKVLTA